MTREETREYNRKYRLKHKERIDALRKEWCLKNKEKVVLSRRKNKLKNKEKISLRRGSLSFREKRREWYHDNKEKNRSYRKQYRLDNRKKVLANQRSYQNNKSKTSIHFRIARNLRERLRGAIKLNAKVGSAVRDLGCTIPELRMYLEGQFKDGMTWENWGLHGFHIDHKIPLAFFDLTDREQFLQAVHYTNLQPMWAKENWSKGAKILWK